MRKYQDEEKKMLAAVVCNGCGRKLRVENGDLKEGCFEGKQTFGYFSGRDGLRHSFDLCEDCYQRLIRQFALPVEEEEITEFL